MTIGELLLDWRFLLALLTAAVSVGHQFAMTLNLKSRVKALENRCSSLAKVVTNHEVSLGRLDERATALIPQLERVERRIEGWLAEKNWRKGE